MSSISNVVRGSVALVISIENGDPPDDVCEALGRALTLGKPIICIVRPGVNVPNKLATIVDRNIEWVDDQNALATAVRDTIVDMGLLTGVPCGCEECKKKADADRSWNDGGNSQN